MTSSRDERRWIEKQNKAARLKLKREENARMRQLVGQCPVYLSGPVLFSSLVLMTGYLHFHYLFNQHRMCCGPQFSLFWVNTGIGVL